jgi:hypothetical protein
VFSSPETFGNGTVSKRKTSEIAPVLNHIQNDKPSESIFESFPKGKYTFTISNSPHCLQFFFFHPSWTRCSIRWSHHIFLRTKEVLSELVTAILDLSKCQKSHTRIRKHITVTYRILRAPGLESRSSELEYWQACIVVWTLLFTIWIMRYHITGSGFHPRFSELCVVNSLLGIQLCCTIATLCCTIYNKPFFIQIQIIIIPTYFNHAALFYFDAQLVKHC